MNQNSKDEVKPIAGSFPLKKLSHEKFCQLYVASCAGNASEAYRIAFETKSKNVKPSASRLLTNVNLQKRIIFLRKQQETILATDREEWLKDVIRVRRESIFPGDKYKGLDMIAKAQGYYAPEKQEHSGHVSLLKMFEQLNGTANTLDGKVKK
jgi:hypothetical protein